MLASLPAHLIDSIAEVYTGLLCSEITALLDHPALRGIVDGTVFAAGADTQVETSAANHRSDQAPSEIGARQCFLTSAVVLTPGCAGSVMAPIPAT